MKKPHICYLIILVVAIASSLVVYRGSIKGWYHRKFLKPTIISGNTFVDLDKSPSSNIERIKFITHYQEKTPFYGLRVKKETIEGDGIRVYAITQSGVVSVIIDYTRDSYGIREYKTYHSPPASLGYFDKDEFIEVTLDSSTSTKRNLLLRFMLNNDFIYF